MNVNEFSDAQLMLLFRHGRQDAFRELFGRHHKRVYRIACRICGSAADGDEVVQDVFLRVARAAERYEPTASFTTWLHRIAVNSAINQAKRTSRATNVIEFASVARSAPRSDGPDVALERQELSSDVEHALGELPVEQRAPLVLRVFESLPYSEIAALLEIPVGTAKIRVHRGRATLRRTLTQHLVAHQVGVKGGQP